MNIDQLWGPALGIMGGLVGTFLSIKNTNGPRERAFMIRSAIVAWITIFAVIGLVVVLPNPHRWILFGACFVILLPAGIVYGNRTQKRIRHDESAGQPVQKEE